MSELIKYWANKGKFDFAKRISQIIGSEWHNSTNLLNISLAQIRFGKFTDSLETARGITEHRQEHFYKLAVDLVKEGAYSEFFKLLPSFSENCTMIYMASGLLAQVFPDQVEQISSRLLVS